MEYDYLVAAKNYVSPFTDWGFKRIFGVEEIMINFLNTLLKGEQEPIVKITYLNTEQVRENEKARTAIFDIYCEAQDGKKFIVEMQNSFQEHFVDRMIYYSSQSIVRNAKKGDKWNYNMEAVYSIAFLNYEDDRIGKDVRTDAAVCDIKDGRKLSNLLRYIFIQLPKFNKSVEQCEEDFEKWIYVLKNMDVLERLPKSLYCKGFDMLKTVTDVEKLSAKDRAIYEDAQRIVWDYNSVIDGAEYLGHKKGLAEGEAKGRAEGEAKGRAEGEAKGRAEGATEQNIKNAKSMKSEGLSADMISRITGLSIDEINKL